MQILWWLAPPVVATVLAMLWVSWLGRASRGEVDREAAVRRLADALTKPTKVSARPAAPRSAPRLERGTGVAVRPSRRPPQAPAPAEQTVQTVQTEPGEATTRRAS